MSKRQPASHNHGDWAGKALGQYTILEEIGRGGMATVYRAKQQSLDRTVAIKILPPYFLHDPSFFERFEREVDVVAKLEHPHILPIYDYGEIDGVPYIVMRYLGGGSMAELVPEGMPSLDRLVKPLHQVAQALDYAHERGIIHRDLKPGNIMLDESGNAYLSDFGIARVIGSNLTGTNIVGTPAYMSPELINGQAVDKRSDIYALGIVVYELIAGEQPFQADTLAALLFRHVNKPLPSLREFRDDVPLVVERVLVRATAKDPAERFDSAGELAQAFDEAIQLAAVATLPLPIERRREIRARVGTEEFDETMTLRLRLRDYDDTVLVRFAQQDTWVLGRLDDPSIPVDVDFNTYDGFEKGVSRCHAELYFNRKERCLYVCDLNSSNGTFVNGERLGPGKYHTLRDGDELRLSRLVLHVFFEEE